MNKVELVAAMAEQAGLSKKDAEKALNAFVDVVETEVADGKVVQLVGFGTFGRTMQNARVSFGKKVPEKYVPKFKAGKTFKDLVEAGK